MFLKQIQPQALRQLRLRQLILLILRTLLILLLILAFSRPRLGTGTFGGNRILTLVFVDNTASMRPFFERGQMVTLLQGLSRSLSDRQLYFIGLADTIISTDPLAIKATWRNAGVTSPYSFSQRHWDFKRYDGSQVVFVSDGQEPQFLRKFKNFTQTVFLRTLPQADAGLEKVDLEEKLFLPQDKLALQVEVTWNDTGVGLTNLDLYVNSRRMAHKALVFQHRPTTQIKLETKVGGSELFIGKVQLKEDWGNWNNNWYFVVPVNRTLQCEVLTGEALLPWESLATSFSAVDVPVNISVKPSSSLPSFPLPGTVWLVPAPENFPLEAMQRYMEQGGQCVLVGAVPQSMQSVLGFSAHQPDRNPWGFGFHTLPVKNSLRPWLERMAEAVTDGRLTIRERYVSSEARFQGQVLMAYEDGIPMVSMGQLGRGQWVWLNMGTSFQPGSLWMMGLFPPFFFALARHGIPAASLEDYRFEVGDTLTFPIKDPLSTASLRLQLPGGGTFLMRPDKAGRWRFDQTETPGVYRLFNGTRLVSAVAVNLPVSELKSVPVKWQNELPTFVQMATTASEAADFLLKQSRAVIITGWLLFLALLCLVAENILSRTKYQ